ncbi:MAG: HAD-IA family hydrolase [Pseudomonadota bacterium]|nr:HAD-IA family hydrolase [Pseudomonadota bacterium]MEE3072550.1 HAD-IA family hydrolase [Pseudomonadota bacterium]
MSDTLRLIIFDVDGTLVDSQADILASMQAGFAAVGQVAPERAQVLSIVGMSLDNAVAELAPDLDQATRDHIVATYKDTYAQLRASKGTASSPFYPGVRETLEQLFSVPHYLLGVATGKSRRGLTSLLDSHGLTGRFVTEQVADFHPSKPHPAMLHEAMRETGIDPQNTVMIGDTSFDIEMAKAAGVHPVGVSWGYHPVQRLNAPRVIDRMQDLPALLTDIWS